MNLEQLRCFITVVEKGSFHAAANYLHRSQPAITNSVKNLEIYLDVQLFDRSQYGAKLTAYGRAFYQRARSLLDHSLALQHYANCLKQQFEPQIALAIDTIVPLNEYLPILHKLMQQFPQTNFRLSLEALSGATERILDQNADIAITDYSNPHAEIESSPLGQIPLIAVATPEFIEQNQGKLFDSNRFNECTQIVIYDSSLRLEKQSIGIVDNARHCVVVDIHSKKQLICANIGWGRLPDYAVRHELASGKLQQLTDDHFHCRDVNLHILRRKQQIHGIVANAVWDLLIQKIFSE